jgi:hypothetical protein
MIGGYTYFSILHTFLQFYIFLFLRLLPQLSKSRISVFGIQCPHCTHVIKIKAMPSPRATVQFKINGNSYSVDESIKTNSLESCTSLSFSYFQQLILP